MTSCEICGSEARERCTNGRCMKCHLTECTGGGNTSPGHARKPITGDQLERHDMRRTVRLIYEQPQGAAGCCLHVVVDDGNVGDNAVEVCLKAAEESGHVMCQTVARFLNRIDVPHRRSFIRYLGGKPHG